MELDWTTVALEMLNFLVLAWLLKRFLYQPVLNVIAQRQEANQKILTDAEDLRRAADAAKTECKARLAAIGLEREQALARLAEEIAEERGQRLAALETEVTTERARRNRLEERARNARIAAQEEQAIALAGRFASRLLDRLAGPVLETQLVDLVLAELTGDHPAKLVPLRAALQAPEASVRVLTAFPLAMSRRTALAAALAQLSGRAVQPEFAEDASLKAGLCLMAGAWTVQANLRDELAFFSEVPANE